MWRHKGRAGHTRPPDYENSIDAQIADLDPLVEAKVPLFEEVIEPWHDHYRAVLNHSSGHEAACGYGPTRASARLKALLVVLEAQP